VNRDERMTRSPGHHAMLNFHEPMHGDLIFDPGVKDPRRRQNPPQRRKVPATKINTKFPGKNEAIFSRTTGKMKPSKTTPPRRSFSSRRIKEGGPSLFPVPQPCISGKGRDKDDPFNHHQNLLPTHQDFQSSGIMREKASSQGGKDDRHRSGGQRRYQEESRKQRGIPQRDRFCRLQEDPV